MEAEGLDAGLFAGDVVAKVLAVAGDVGAVEWGSFANLFGLQFIAGVYAGVVMLLYAECVAAEVSQYYLAVRIPPETDQIAF